MSIVPVYIPSPCNVFLYFLRGQMHKDSKLGVMTNVGKNRRDRRDNKVITILAANNSSRNTGIPHLFFKGS